MALRNVDTVSDRIADPGSPEALVVVARGEECKGRPKIIETALPMIMLIGHNRVKASRREARRGEGIVDPVTVVWVISVITGAVGTAVSVWVRGRVQRCRAREEARIEHLRWLPPGSRVVDLGERGLVIEVGREFSPDVRG